MDAKIKKMQEMIYKDLEELKNEQTEMNKKITETKNTLEGINSRITETEEQISDQEDRRVEFTAVKQNKDKRMKEMKTAFETSGTTLHAPTFTFMGPRRKKERERTQENI